MRPCAAYEVSLDTKEDSYEVLLRNHVQGRIPLLEEEPGRTWYRRMECGEQGRARVFLDWLHDLQLSGNCPCRDGYIGATIIVICPAGVCGRSGAIERRHYRGHYLARTPVVGIAGTVVVMQPVEVYAVDYWMCLPCFRGIWCALLRNDRPWGYSCDDGACSTRFFFRCGNYAELTDIAFRCEKRGDRKLIQT